MANLVGARAPQDQRHNQASAYVWLLSAWQLGERPRQVRGAEVS